MKWDNIWRYGANFIPSTAINQLEMWQEDTFDPETIDRELGWAEKIGMSIMRVFLHDLLWEQDAPGFLKRMERYLEIAASHHIVTMFVFFDDCWSNTFALGKQPEPKPETHNSGWVKSPGYAAADDLSQRPRLERYVKGVLTHFAHDERIALWDLFNEPGNGLYEADTGDANSASAAEAKPRCMDSMPLLRDIFTWAREARPDQPVTAGAWAYNDKFLPFNDFQYSASDVVSFHSYDDKVKLQERIDAIRKQVGYDRPLLCSEYMARCNRSTFQECLPVLKANNVIAINWGLVSGKTQTIYPWSCYIGKPDSVPFHDVFDKDGPFLKPEDEAVFKAMR